MDVNPKTSKISRRRATVKEVAAEVGVSPATVSNAYNRPDQLSPELRARIFAAAKELGYSGPDPVARGLRRRRTGVMGVLYPDRLSYAFADPVSVMFLEGVSEAAEEARLGLLLVPGTPREERGPAAVGEAAVDGFVIYCLANDDPLVDAALERRLPVVLVEQPPREDVPSVITDDVGRRRAPPGTRTRALRRYLPRARTRRQRRPGRPRTAASGHLSAEPPEAPGIRRGFRGGRHTLGGRTRLRGRGERAETRQDRRGGIARARSPTHGDPGSERSDRPRHPGGRQEDEPLRARRPLSGGLRRHS